MREIKKIKRERERMNEREREIIKSSQSFII